MCKNLEGVSLSRQLHSNILRMQAANWQESNTKNDTILETQRQTCSFFPWVCGNWWFKKAVTKAQKRSPLHTETDFEKVRGTPITGEDNLCSSLSGHLNGYMINNHHYGQLRSLKMGSKWLSLIFKRAIYQSPSLDIFETRKNQSLVVTINKNCLFTNLFPEVSEMNPSI